jgi:hypothetical protein
MMNLTIEVLRFLDEAIYQSARSLYLFSLRVHRARCRVAEGGKL